MFKTTKKIALIGFLALGLGACEQQSTESILKNIEYHTFQQNNEVFVSMKTELDTDSIIVSAATLPIYDKKNPTRLLGQVDVDTNLETMKSTLTVTLNTTISLNLPNFTYDSHLPNGLRIPISGVDLSKMIAFEVGEKGSKLYVHYDAATKKAVLGVALNIESLSIGTPASIFAVFNQNNVKGLAGFYFGDKVNTSGLGVFASLNNLFGRVEMNAIIGENPSSEVEFIHVNNYYEVKSLVDWKLLQLKNANQPLVIK